MIYEHQYEPSKPVPVNLFPAIPEHSLYFYPRDPLVVHYLENDTAFTCPPSIIIGPQVERVNLSLGYDHLVVRVGFHAGDPGRRNPLLRRLRGGIGDGWPG